MKNIHYILLGIVLLLVFSKCDEMGDLCLSNQNAVQAGLYSTYHTADKDTVMTDLYIKGIGNDSLLYSDASANKLFLPLSMHNDSTAFQIKIKTLLDTLWFSYSRKLVYVSGDCGMFVESEIDTVWFTGRFIDSVAIIDPYIRYNENIENIKIYIK
jgi:hypothetical protein